MRAFILAAGFGTRLGELSAERPKPLLPVCDRPLVTWVAGYCVHHGIDNLTVNLHHMGDLVRDELAGAGLAARISYSPEVEILGTGGGIRAMARIGPRGTVVVINGKIITDVDLPAVIEHHRRSGALATAVLYACADAERWGALGGDGEGRMTRLLQQRRGEVTREGMFTGIQVLEPEFIDAIPDRPCCVIRTAYTELFARGAPMSVFFHRGYFHEHSTPERYLRGNFNLLDRMAAPPGAPGRLRGVDPTARVDASAEVIEPVLVGRAATVAGGACVGPHVVIGAGSSVAAGVQIARSVIWPRARVASDCDGAIVTVGGPVQTGGLR